MIRKALAVAMLLVTSSMLTSAAAVDPALGRLPTEVHDALTIEQMGAMYGDDFVRETPPPGQTPEQRADWVLDQRPALGRAPMDWVHWVHATFRISATPARGGLPARAADLTAGVARLYAATGLRADVDEIAARAAAVPDEVRPAFADLVQVVANAYELQVPIARGVKARWIKGFEPATPMLAPAERDLMAATQASILRAIDGFRSRTDAYFDRPGPEGTPIFSDPEGLVILGSVGDDTYTRSGLIDDPILLIDPAGNDRYLTSAGGACPIPMQDIPDWGQGTWMECNGLSVSVLGDLGDDQLTNSDDVYLYNDAPSAVQGAGGPGGLGILVDVGGNDQYLATMTRANTEPFQLTYYFDGGGQGYGYGGVGLLLDGLGDDVYRFDVNSTRGQSIWALAQGFGGAGGLGIASDLTGNDQWLSNGLGLIGGGFEGIYTVGVGFYLGIGIATDTGLGNDVYRAAVTATTVDFYAIGFGAFGGVGLFYEDGGNDDYYTYQKGTNSWINPLLNCGFGTASFGGVGAMLEMGGNDTYYGESHSVTGGATVTDSGFAGPGVAYGVFMDTGGNDRYEMVARGSHTELHGRGLYEVGFTGDPFGNPFGHNSFGTFVDIGGTDTYIGGYGSNNLQWPFGVDRGA